jgi:uncharacterized membrane protein YqjE
MTDGIPGTTGPKPGKAKRSLFELLADIPDLVTDLVQREIELFKTEVAEKLKALGTGGGLLAGAAVALLYMIGVLLTSAVLALSLVMPGWAAALVVAAFLLVVAAVLAFIGYRILEKSKPYYPVDAIDSVKKDLRAIQGIGQRRNE